MSSTLTSIVQEFGHLLIGGKAERQTTAARQARDEVDLQSYRPFLEAINFKSVTVMT